VGLLRALMSKAILDTYHIRDAREMLSVLPAPGIIDTTITSPPYWNLKNYGTKSQVGFGQGYEEYLDELKAIFANVYEATKKTGSLWIVIDTVKHNGELKLLPFDLANRLKSLGWILHDIIVWHKDKTLPWSHRGKLRNIFEYILFFSKGKNFKYFLSRVRETEGLKEWWVRYPERYSPQGKAPTRTWSIPIPRQGSWGENWVRHFCPLPPDLVRRIALLTTKKGDVVLDPFAGSGVVLAQAKALERHFIGLDLRKSYRLMFEREVLPSVVNLERQSQRSQHSEAKKRRAFSSLIWRLRKTKYPRELFRLYKAQYGRAGIVGMMAFSRKARRLDVTFIFAKRKQPARRFIARVKRLMSQPPLSKYGLQITVKSATFGTNAKNALGNSSRVRERLSLYEDGKTYQVSGHVTAKTFIESLRNGQGGMNRVPPIVSNVMVNVPIGTKIPVKLTP
jgi:DNA modification methylase